jgi:hypothetical protein
MLVCCECQGLKRASPRGTASDSDPDETATGGDRDRRPAEPDPPHDAEATRIDAHERAVESVQTQTPRPSAATSIAHQSVLMRPFRVGASFGSNPSTDAATPQTCR